MNAIKTFNQSFSCLYPLVLPTVLDFTAGNAYIADFTEMIDRGVIDFVSSVYVNTQGLLCTLTLTSNVCNHKVIVPPDTIMYAPLFLGNAPKIACSIDIAINDTMEIIVANIPFFPFMQSL